MTIEKESKEFLYNLLKTPSVTGFEQEIQKVVRARMKPFAETITTDLHGNVIIGINTKAKRRVMMSGHCDQIGFMVKHITDDGFLYMFPVGGIDASVLWGAKINIYNEKGTVLGVFGRKLIHHQTQEERTKPTIDLNKMWVDIGAKNKKEALKMVSIGECATVELSPFELGKNLVCSPGLDDKAGLFIVMEALRIVSQKVNTKKAKLNIALYCVSTVQEEVGLRGARTSAYSIDPEVGIGVDVGAATDNPASEEKKDIPCKLGAGPSIPRGPNINPVVEKLMTTIAKKKKIPYQPDVRSGLLGTDTNMIQVSKGGVAAGGLHVPNRYMHTQVEVCHYDDLTNSAKLLAEFALAIDDKISFVP